MIGKHLIVSVMAGLLSFSAWLSGNDQGGNAYVREIEKWRSDRTSRLRSEDGWLTLIGLHWLKPGENKMGSAETSHIRLPSKAPGNVGSFFLEKNTVRFVASPDSGVRKDDQFVESIVMETDQSENTTLLQVGSISFYVIQRSDKLGVRLKDKDSEARTNFRGIDYYPIDPKWRIKARFEPNEKEKSIPILNIVGLLEETPSPGSLAFEMNGKTYRLAALLNDSAPRMFIMFADQTSGKETYGAGRYMYVDPPGSDGTVILDFNKAYNPPCAFTAFATCPLPPPQNRLAVRITAGEKNYSGANESH